MKAEILKYEKGDIVKKNKVGRWFLVSLISVSTSFEYYLRTVSSFT